MKIPYIYRIKILQLLFVQSIDSNQINYSNSIKKKDKNQVNSPINKSSNLYKSGYNSKQLKNSQTWLQITNQHKQVISSLSLRQALSKKYQFIIQSQQNQQNNHKISTNDNPDMLWVIFNLLQQENGSIIASGYIKLQETPISLKSQSIIKCLLKQKGQLLFTLKIGLLIYQDEQKIRCSVPQSDQQQDKTKQIGEQLKNEHIKNNRVKTKNKKRHYKYQTCSNQQILIVKNKITSELNTVLSNIYISDEVIIQKIIFWDIDTNQKIGQIIVNPKIQQKSSNYLQLIAEQLKMTKIKISSSVNQVQIQVIDYEGNVLKGVADMYVLDDSKDINKRKIQTWLRSQAKVKARFIAHYTLGYEEKSSDKKQKLYHNVEYFKQKDYALPHLNDYIHNANSKNMPILPLIYQRNQYAKKLRQIQTIQDRRNYQTQLSRPLPISPKSPIQSSHSDSNQIENNFRNFMKNRQKSQLMNQINYYRQKRNNTINTDVNVSVRSAEMQQKLQYKIRVSSVLVQFYDNYFVNNNISIQKDRVSGKYLQIYSNFSKIFRSDPTFSTCQALTWKLQNCEITIRDIHTISIQVYLFKQKIMIGQATITLSKLINCAQKQTYYKGHIILNRQVVGQITMNFYVRQLERFQRIKRAKTTSKHKLNLINERLRLGISPYPKNINEISSNNLLSAYQMKSIPQISKTKKKKKA